MSRVGCVLYEMLAGEPPFTGPTAQAIIANYAHFLLAVGQCAQSAAETERARRLGKGQTDNAVAAMRKAASLSDDLPFAEAALARSLAKAGKTQEAKQLLDGLLKKALSG